MTKTKALPVEVFALGRCNGDCGPCDSTECVERATHKVQVFVGSVQTLAYVCDEHYGEVMST